MEPFYAVGSVMSVTVPVLFNRSLAATRQFGLIAFLALTLGYWWTRDPRALGYWGSLVLVIASAHWWFTVQQRAERREKRYRDELEAAVSARTRELQAANEELRQQMEERRALQDRLVLTSKLEGLGRLAGGIAHDYNNLLTAILGSVEFLVERLPRDSEELAEAQNIQEAGESAARVTRHLLAFSRSSPIETTVLDPAEALTAMTEMLERLLGRVELVVELHHGAARIRANRGQFEQVLLNLVLNARDAMAAGGTVFVQTRLRQDGDRRWFVLSVRDTGAGMDAQTRARIFDPFFTTKEVGSGTGLGLSIAHAIVERAGGTIEVESELGRGSTFEVHWPAVPEVADQVRDVAAPRTSGNERVLVVDDDPRVRRVLCRMLAELGYRPVEASGGLEGLRVATSQPVDLVLTDVVMPGVTGPQLAKHLAEAGVRAPVVFISGYPAREGMFGETLPEGARFLPKPIGRDELGVQVRLALESASGGADRGGSASQRGSL
jgi:signal transduction histidine kinase/CheY-like chemotaxis protein